MANYSRKQRVGDQLQRELALLLTTRASDPRFHQVSLTAVEISADMSNAHIFVSLLDEAQQKEIIAALNKAAGFFRTELAHILNLRITPRLKFVYDDSMAKGNRLTNLINSVTKSDEEQI